MITDIFARRYEGVELRSQYFEEDRRFMNQAAAMIMDPLWMGQKSDPPSKITETCLKEVHDTIALELGQQYLSESHWFQTYTINGNQHTQPHAYSYANICKNFLVKMPAAQMSADTFIKERMSLVEFAFRKRWLQIQEINRQLPAEITRAEWEDSLFDDRKGMRVPGKRVDGVRALHARINAAFDEVTHDLCERLRLAKYRLTFHNGIIQFAEDEVINAQVAKPFWAQVAGPQWSNVDEQIKEAIDRRDRGDRTAAFHATCALESAIKIISDIKGWTTGSEKGAANYVDNLVSKNNGRFIEPWESEMLKSMFSDVRNPFAHGPGQAPIPTMTPEQTDWTIDTAMSWIKNLIRRI